MNPFRDKGETWRVITGDALAVLKKMPSDSVDLIMTSPPYADSRKKTYGGVAPAKYVQWFIPIADQLHRVLKPEGTFILNKELGRLYLGIEINPEYAKMAERRIADARLVLPGFEAAEPEAVEEGMCGL